MLRNDVGIGLHVPWTTKAIIFVGYPSFLYRASYQEPTKIMVLVVSGRATATYTKPHPHGWGLVFLYVLAATQVPPLYYLPQGSWLVQACRETVRVVEGRVLGGSRAADHCRRALELALRQRGFKIWLVGSVVWLSSLRDEHI